MALHYVAYAFFSGCEIRQRMGCKENLLFLTCTSTIRTLGSKGESMFIIASAFRGEGNYDF